MKSDIMNLINLSGGRKMKKLIANRFSTIFVIAALFCTVFGAGRGQAVTIEEYLTPTNDSSPTDLSFDADGILWFTEIQGNRIGKLDPAKAKAGTSDGFSEFQVPTADSRPNNITVARDGTIWFTEMQGNKVGRLDPKTGIIKEYAIPTQNSEPHDILEGSDGNIWFLEFETNKVGRLDPATGAIREYPVGKGNPHAMVIKDSTLWFTQGGKFWAKKFANKLGGLDIASGKFFDIPVPPKNSVPHAIALAKDGSLWFSKMFEQKLSQIQEGSTKILDYPLLGNKRNPHDIFVDEGRGWIWFTQIRHDSIGRLDLARAKPETSKGMEEYKLPTKGAHPSAITMDKEGNLWFTEMGHFFRGHFQNKIGKLVVGEQ